ncbi:MAG TPA: glycoside hydrolase family 130 protein [Candidatus Eremiobacteraceae bacterium]|nr:glycoside hydrolase family 130 protein [Candidatus Eremiobacteraceae bacterium]
MRVANSRIVIAILLLAVSVTFAAPAVNLPFGDWVRAADQAVLSPRGTTWESAGVFNPAVVFAFHKSIMLYRAQDSSGTSRIGYAESTDGIHFTRRDQPVLLPEARYEQNGGVEDPRLQKISGTFYLTYTGYNKKDAQLCLAKSRDLLHWERKGVILPAYQGNWNVGWTKSGAIVPETIDGKYWMYWLGTSADKTDQMGLSFSGDLIHWTEATETPVLPKRPGKFDSRVVEPGPPPIITTEGIVLIYNGADDNLVYRTGVAIFDAHNPRHLLYRSEEPIFGPEKEWEKVGQVPNVVFVEGLVKQNKRFLFYYGAADKYIGVAEAPARIFKAERGNAARATSLFWR